MSQFENVPCALLGVNMTSRRVSLGAALLTIVLAACAGPSESTWTYNPTASGSPNPATQESPGPAGAPGGPGRSSAAGSPGTSPVPTGSVQPSASPASVPSAAPSAAASPISQTTAVRLPT